MDEEIKVSYGLNDVLENLQKTISTNHGELKGLIASKADKADVTRLEGALEAHRRETDSRLRPLETERQSALVRRETSAERIDKTTAFRRAIYGLLVLAAYWFGPVIDKAITH